MCPVAYILVFQNSVLTKSKIIIIIITPSI